MKSYVTPGIKSSANIRLVTHRPCPSHLLPSHTLIFHCPMLSCS
jgi:hypothetical protein